MGCLISAPTFADLGGSNQILLSEPFSVYTDGTTVINHPEQGFTETLLPTINLYKGNPGCYIACYSRQKDNAIYSIGDNIYVLGQVRIAGKYNINRCEPTNFAGKDISADATFKTICSEKIEACTGGHCWADGETGAWFEAPLKK
jgi:hypothetical protein